MQAPRRKLRFGLWYAFRNPLPWPTSFESLYGDVIDQIAWAETIGYDDVWLTEHHFVEDGHAPSPLVQAAAIAVRTKRIRIGTAVLLLPLYHPVRVAEDGATVDILSGGRFELGVGSGYSVEEFAGLGISRSERAGRMNEGLEIIRRLWDGESVTFHGKHFRIEGARLSPMPVQQPRPPIWAGGFGPAAMKRAARLADGYIGTGDVAALGDAYRAELRALGKDGAAARVAGGHFWIRIVPGARSRRTFAIRSIYTPNGWKRQGRACFRTSRTMRRCGRAVCCKSPLPRRPCGSSMTTRRPRGSNATTRGRSRRECRCGAWTSTSSYSPPR
jgi:probable F420-dependent oxidoreductase